MKAFRYFSMALGLLNMLGEFYRSVGDGRHIMFVLDDTFLGLALILSAVWFTKDTPPRRAFFAASWSDAAGIGRHAGGWLGHSRRDVSPCSLFDCT